MMHVILDASLLMAVAGFMIGLAVGSTGVGAGALTTPMLVSGFGVPPPVAVGTDLMFAAITKSTAAWRHHRLGNVDWPVLGWMAAGSVSASLVVLAWLYLMTPDTARLAVMIRQTLAVALIASAIAIPCCPWLMRTAGQAASRNDVRCLRPLPTLALGLLLGALVTVTSVGAGAIGVAALNLLYPTLLARYIVGTDVVHAIPLTLISGLGHLGLGHVDGGVLVALLVGSIPGIAVGSRMTNRLPDWLLRLCLAVVLASAAATLIVRG